MPFDLGIWVGPGVLFQTVTAPPPGWYPDSYGVTRYWDGRRWTAATGQPQRYVPPPRRSHTARNVILIILGCLVIGGIATAIAAAHKPSSNGTTPTPGVSRGLGGSDASGDVTVGTVGYDGAFAQAPVTVTNHSSKRSDYSITVALESASGATQLDTGDVFVQGLEAGQTTKQTATFLSLPNAPPAGARVVLKEVQRLASN